MTQIAIPSPLNNFLELQLKSREGHDSFCSKVKEIPPRSIWKNIAPSLSQAYHFTTSNPFEVSCYLKRKNDIIILETFHTLIMSGKFAENDTIHNPRHEM